jgi:hypothetical protein
MKSISDMLPSIPEQYQLPPQAIRLAVKFGLIRSFNLEHGSPSLTYIDDLKLQVLSELLTSRGRDRLENRAVIKTFTRMSVNGFDIHSRSTSKAKGNSYTIEFNDDGSGFPLALLTVLFKFRMSSMF